MAWRAACGTFCDRHQLLGTPIERRPGLRSRGHLVTDFLQGEQSPVEYLETIHADDYAGFNLLVADGTSLAYLSNRGGGCANYRPGYTD